MDCTGERDERMKNSSFYKVWSFAETMGKQGAHSGVNENTSLLRRYVLSTGK